MATWITHLRIAEKLLKEFDFFEDEFIVGNIGPDCGVPNDDWSKFDPPKEITHCYGDNLSGDHISKIDPDKFYRNYILDDINKKDKKELSFLFGYYSHLITDVKWSNMERRKRREDLEYAKKFSNDPGFIWEVKKDWYGLDFIYLKENSKNIFSEVFTNIKSVEDYLDYFPKGAITKQIEYIGEFYKNYEDDFIATDRYLKREDVNEYVNNTTKIISEKLRELYK